MKKIRWGLLSTARINRRLIPAIRASKRGELAAVASRDQQKASAYAAEWNIPRVFGSYEAMLSSDEIDAVYISLPNNLHAEWTVRALEAGKHVLCEKPFAVTVEEVDQMIAAQNKTGLVLAEGFMYRHHPQTRAVQQWIREGRLGDISLVRAAFSFFMQNRAGNVRLNPETGGGALWDVGIYPISFSQMVFGALPEGVTGQQWTGDTGVDESFSGQLHYSNGRASQIACSFRIPHHTAAEIHGTEGRITLNRPFTQIDDKGREAVFTPSTGKAEKIRTKNIDPYLGEVEDMHAAILDGQPPLISLDESRHHVQTALALYQSARTGTSIKVS